MSKSTVNTWRSAGLLKVKEHKRFLEFLASVKESQMEHITLDFEECRRAYPNTMLPIVSAVQQLRRAGVTCRVMLPREQSIKRLFLNCNWAHYLDPSRFDRAESYLSQHLPAIKYRDGSEQFEVVSQFLDSIMSSLSLSRDHIASLEWSINEITDNVLNHSNSSVGGFIQMSTLKDRVNFCVADAGEGILTPLRRRYTAIDDDVAAINLAVRAGVTRDPDKGRGNGMTGSLSIGTKSGGSFRVMSGNGEVIWMGGMAAEEKVLTSRFDGTLVDIQVRTDIFLDLREVLSGLSLSKAYRPMDVVETRFTSDSGEELHVAVAKEANGFGTRQSGAMLRTKCQNLLAAEPTLPLVLDWANVPLITSSFADEFLAKLREAMGSSAFETRVHMRNLPGLVHEVIRLALSQR